MSFFANRPRGEPAEPEPPRVEPEWFGPPRGVLPGNDSQRSVLFRTPEAILVVGKFDVFATGVMFSIDLQLRTQNVELEHMPWEFYYRSRSAPEVPNELIRLGIVFADGSSWSNLDTRVVGVDTAPPAPFVMPGGGGGGGGDRWWASQWLWPLPPEGPLTFVAEWPLYGISETTAVIDASALRSAASRAEHLWS